MPCLKIVFVEELEFMRNNPFRLICALAVAVIAYWSVSADFYAINLPEGNQSTVRNEPASVETERKMRTGEDPMEGFKKQILPEKASPEESATYSLMPEDFNHNIFVNRVDGYSIRVPQNLNVDMSFAGIRAVLTSKELQLEIYRQPIDLKHGGGIESYINYSNLFLQNRVDHKLERKEKINLGGYQDVSLLKWSRKALRRVPDDKCFYVSIDIPISKDEVLTFLFKSSKALDEESYLAIAGSLELTEKTAEPYIRTIRQVDHKSWNKETADVYRRIFLENERLYWGIFETDAPLNFTELKKIESKLNFTFPILLYYTGLLENEERHPNLPAALQNAKKEGRLLELTLQTVEQSPEKGNMVYDVLDGNYDRYLKNYAAEVAASKAPVLFRLGNEMNGDWCVYSALHTSKDPEIFKAFYRYLYAIFEEADADNVIWIWNPNGKSFPDYKWNEELCYYPGDEYVDVIGMTNYNTGTYYESENWSEFDQLYDELYAKYVQRYDKPLMITEFSSSSVGGSKENWVANMFQHIGKYKRLRVAIWWDGCDWDQEGNVARSYFIDESEELVRLFRDNLARFH